MPARRPVKKVIVTKVVATKGVATKGVRAKAPAPKAQAAPKPTVDTHKKAGGSMAMDILQRSGGAPHNSPGQSSMTGRAWKEDHTPNIQLELGEDDPATPPIAPVAPVPNRLRNKKR